jgi:hypothetical protein
MKFIREIMGRKERCMEKIEKYKKIMGKKE